MPSIPVTARLDKPLYTDVCTAAEQRGVKVSVWIRDAVVAYLSERPTEHTIRRGPGPSPEVREGAMILVALGRVFDALSEVPGEMSIALANDVREASRVAVEHVVTLR